MERECLKMTVSKLYVDNPLNTLHKIKKCLHEKISSFSPLQVEMLYKDTLQQTTQQVKEDFQTLASCQREKMRPHHKKQVSIFILRQLDHLSLLIYSYYRWNDRHLKEIFYSRIYFGDTEEWIVFYQYTYWAQMLEHFAPEYKNIMIPRETYLYKQLVSLYDAQTNKNSIHLSRPHKLLKFIHIVAPLHYDHLQLHQRITNLLEKLTSKPFQQEDVVIRINALLHESYQQIMETYQENREQWIGGINKTQLRFSFTHLNILYAYLKSESIKNDEQEFFSSIIIMIEEAEIYLHSQVATPVTPTRKKQAIHYDNPIKVTHPLERTKIIEHHELLFKKQFIKAQLPIFLKLFSQQPIHEVIVWHGSQRDLHTWLTTLKKMNIISIPHGGWQQISQMFVSEKNEHYTAQSLTKSKESINKEQIELWCNILK
ncbi:hypothetical protein K5X82_15190 [Halosquirtibacter xylanolyticus]|uniref:hypothetical protein n=1 Tax=Halosquirtibacter xylanolyticus TaxID=3374599 RepID=UPI00374848C3|nr:hypothetical protein K5X82_15190 [Prolixibacteraceae bacterium]